MKKENKINKIIILGIIVLIITISIVIFILNYTKDDSSFSLIEKNWINNNSNKMIDVSIYNDIPIYGESGEGISFSLLEEFTNTYGIEFNKISYLNNTTSNDLDFSFKIIDYDTNLTSKDILMYEDYYVILSKEKGKIDRIENIEESSLGVFTKDLEKIKYFLNDNEKITYTAYDNIEDLLKNLESDKVDYIAIPKTEYLSEILEHDLEIVYHISEYYNKYIINIKDNTLRSIIKKYYSIYEKTLKDEKYKSYFLTTFFKYKKISEAEQMSYNSSTYTYGYVPNMPYENTVNKEFVGIISNYLSGFEETAKVEFKIVEYNSIKELKEALSHGEVDATFNTFNLEGLNVDLLKTTSPSEEKYVIISKDKLVINSLRSLKGKEVYTISNSYLYDYLKQNEIKLKGFNNSDELLRNIKSNSIVLIDSETYDYYKNTKFKDYIVNYEDNLKDEYQFVVRDVNKNQTFYELFNYYISDINYKTIMHDYHTDYIINSNNELNTAIKYIIISLASILLFAFLVLFINKKKNHQVKLNKEDKLKFIDSMTSLKNRNYLNYNISKWDENVIYPQAIVIIDLNNIKYINDNYGHEEGDEVIKSAASILLNSQLENTDIVRTDGNEFLVYMVGYDEKGVQDYTRNVNKELKELKHNFGATLGYSMITDNIKTIDDAINEATLSMRQAKERL